eukprot:Amastigsp_a342151_11.p9 type:complete len:101 gc:universal Amastigsp_a342151_11:3742-4044(+)
MNCAAPHCSKCSSCSPTTMSCRTLCNMLARTPPRYSSLFMALSIVVASPSRFTCASGRISPCSPSSTPADGTFSDSRACSGRTQTFRTRSRRCPQHIVCS